MVCHSSVTADLVGTRASEQGDDKITSYLLSPATHAETSSQGIEPPQRFRHVVIAALGAR